MKGCTEMRRARSKAKQLHYGTLLILFNLIEEHVEDKQIHKAYYLCSAVSTKILA
jgi:hypothetical protein